MKREPLFSVLTAAALAFVTAYGAAGCLISAFDLPLEYPYSPVLVCGFSAVVAAALLSLRYGGTVLLCLLALLAGYIYHDGTAGEQLLQLVHHLTEIYDRAYGWGVLTFPDNETAVWFDWPAGILGMAVALSVSLSICRQRSVWLPMLVTILPLCTCIVVTDTVPDEPWLLAVLAGLVLLLLTADLRRENVYQGTRLTAAAALPVVLVLAVLFLANPQESYVNHAELIWENIGVAARRVPQLMERGMLRLTSGLRSQPAKQVDLASLGPRIPFTYPVMEVTAEQSGTLYLREQDYDRYDGLGWTASEGRNEAFPGTTGQGETVRIQTGDRKKVRVLPYYPTGGTVLADGSAANPEQTREYNIQRNRLPEDWRLTAYRNDTEISEEWPQYTALPEATRQGAAGLLEQLYKANASNTAKADIIAALVLDSARYDLDPAVMPAGEGDFALWFLRAGETGYCVHFATAATVLLRAAGVPARYVTGYLLETKAGQAVTVTEENAHAWAEYYEPNLGVWIPLEATPGENTAAVPVLSPTEATVPTQPPETEPAMTEAVEQMASPPEATLPVMLPDVPEPEPVPTDEPSVSAGWLLIPVLVLLLMLQRSVRLTLRRRRERCQDPNRQALYRWQEAVRLSRLLKESPTEELIHLAQKAKFSQHELTEEELTAFDLFNRGCLRRLKKKPWYLRLIYRLIYAAY